MTNLAAVNFPDKHLFNEIATILSNKDVKLNPDAVEDLKDLMKLALSNKAQFYNDGNVGQKVKAIEAKMADMLMNDLRYKTGFKNAIRKKGLNEKPLPGKLKEDRWGDMPKRRDDDERPLPGKLNDDRFGDMGRRRDEESRPLPGKLKNPFDESNKGKGGAERKIPGKLKNRWGPKQKENLPLNRYPGGKKRGKKGQDEPILDNKNQNRKKKGIELQKEKNMNYMINLEID